jgi:preprotein translocase subunit SecG
MLGFRNVNRIEGLLMSAEPSPATKKQLIVVVHGVGIRAAGESSDLVTGALDEGPGGWRRRASDDFRLFQPIADPDAILHEDFPARISRFRRFAGQQPPPEANERVIADFYWGDVGGFKASAPQTLIGLTRVMLGLAHVVRENALSVFPVAETGSRGAFLRGLARFAALAIHGPIFAANIILALGLVGVVLFGAATSAATMFGGVAGLAVATAMYTTSRSFLMRHLASYVGVFGLLLLAFVLAENWPFGAVVAAVADGDFIAGVCSLKPLDSRAACRATYEGGPFLHGVRIQGIMVLLWSGVSAITVFFGLRWLLTLATNPAEARRDLIAPTLSLMALLWFLVIGLAWGAASVAYDQVGAGWLFNLSPAPADGSTVLQVSTRNQTTPEESGKLFTTSLRGIWASLTSLGIVAVLSIAVLLQRRKRLSGMSPTEFLAAPDETAESLRLIVPGLVRFGLLSMPVLILVLILASALTSPGYCSISAEPPLLCWMDTKTAPLVTALVTLALTFGSFFLGAMSMGLYVAGDVIIYLNDFHWRRRPGVAPSRAFAEVLFPGLQRVSNALPADADGYEFRNRIRSRLRLLVNDLIRSEEPDRIDFVCHSQGTVITIEELRNPASGPVWGAGRDMRLTTMGSPWRHLYHTYFPHAFDGFAGPIPGLAQWTNIFRIDDFIGTHVGTSTGPAVQREEFPVPLGGHTNYWRDRNVREILQQRLDFPGPDQA